MVEESPPILPQTDHTSRADDLAAYEPSCYAPVKGAYRGFGVSSNPPPGSGVTLIQMLQILDHFDLASLHHGSAAHLDLVARAMAAAHRDRNDYMADPAFTDVPVDMMLSRERAAMWAEKIRQGEFLGDGQGGAAILHDTSFGL